MSTFQIRNDGMLDPEGKYPNPINGLPYTKNYKVLAEAKWAHLRAYEDRMKILQKIHSKSILLVSLPTGTGKTVVVPRLLYHYYGYEKKIIVTTPRKQTTSAAGEFAALCFDVPLFHVGENGEYITNPAIEKGQENRYPTGNKFISYKHGGSKEYSDKSTKLLFTTDATVKTIITTGDEDLADYGGIVIDEVHERSVSIDIVIALVMDILNRRKDFKIIFMSATMDLKIFEDYFKKLGQGNNYEIYTVKEAKTTHPIAFELQDKPLVKNANKIIDTVYKKIDTLMLELDKSNKGGDILAFVSSDSETNKLKTKINKNISKYSENNRPYVIAMSANTTEDEMNRAKNAGVLKNIKPTKDAPKGYRRKIMIATPMAESSITFSDPLTYVIETGIAYSIHYDADKYCYVFGKNYITQASIKQRCGRTGRTCPGTCIQLYTKKEYDTFPEFSVPEILSEDFTKELLNIMKLPSNEFNITKSLKFIQNMIEPLEKYKSFVKVGFNNIKEMDFIDGSGNITALGYICSEFNTFDIKIAKMIIGGFFFNCIEASIILGAILHTCSSFGEIFKQLSDEDKTDKTKLKAYEDNIKKHIRKEGDHISLLIIYNSFINNNSSFEYSAQNGLDYNILTKIKKAHIELYDTVMTQDIRTRVSMLEKFINIKQFKNQPQYNAVGGFLHKSKTHKKNKYNKYNNYNKYNKYNKYNINNDYRKYNKRYIQNIHSNINLSNRTFKNGGRVLSKSGKHKYKRKTKSKSRYQSKDGISNTDIFDLGLDLVSNLSGGDASDINNKNNKRRFKYMELFTLKRFEGRNKNIKLSKNGTANDIIERVIASLYYGYSTNIACYSGKDKDYKVKFSSIKGTMIGGMSKNSFDFKYPETNPDFIIYNKFTVKKEFGTLDPKGTLNLITILETKHLSYFFDLPDIIKQVMTEIK